MTACLDVVYATDPAIDICEFNDAQFTIAPRCGTRPSSLYMVFPSALQISHNRRNRNSHFDAILLHHLDNLVFGAEKDPRTVDSHPFLKAFESGLVGCC
jgi:hypothetical protein